MDYPNTVYAGRKARVTPLTLALLFCYPLGAQAQADDAGAIPEVIVTAQKRKENLRDAPVSAAVLGVETLAKGGVQTLDDIGKMVPSVVAAPSGGNLRSGFTMRGISTTVVTVGAPSGTAVMIDGVTLAPESMAARQLTDIQNVEVLRGPQATLGGRTASSGEINIVTRTPESTLGGNLGVTITNDGQRRVEGYLTGPVARHVDFSLSGYDGRTDYPTRNVLTGRNDKENASGLRGKLRFTPSDALDVTLTAATLKMDNHGTFQSYVLIDPKAKYRGFITNAASLPGVTPGADNFDYAVRGNPGTDASDHLYSLVANYRLNGWTLSSITASQREDRIFRADVHNQAADWAALLTNGAYHWDQMQDSVLNVRTTSQEFKLVSPQIGIMELLAGAYYGHDKTAFDFVRASFGIPVGPTPFSANRVADTKTSALYGRATWTLTPDATLITGLRVNRDDIGYVYNLRYNTTPASASAPFSRSDSASQNTTVGDIVGRYKFSPSVMGYASYSRGYKPAIWNLDGTITATNSFKPVNRENIDSLELGMKGVFLNRRLTVNAALFKTVYKNFQVQTFDPQAPSATFALSNAGQASTKGLELDGRALLPAQFSLGASLALIDAKFDDYGAATCYTAQTVAQGCLAAASGSKYQSLTGTRLPNAPRWKTSLTLDKALPLEELSFDLKLGGAYTWQSKVNFDPNGNPIAVQQAYGILNLNLQLLDHSSRYDISLFANNVLDKHYVSGITDQGSRWGNLDALSAWRSRDAQRYIGLRLNSYF